MNYEFKIPELLSGLNFVAATFVQLDHHHIFSFSTPYQQTWLSIEHTLNKKLFSSGRFACLWCCMTKARKIKMEKIVICLIKIDSILS
jgi:hypothetical protein